MKIHLLRHAEAEDLASTDSARALTALGRKQARCVGDFLVRTGTPIDLILTSPYLRASQTAFAVEKQIMADSRWANVFEERRLICGMSPQLGLAILQEYSSTRHLLLVGHQPDLSHFAAALLTADRSLDVEFDKASLLTLELTVIRFGSGILDSHLHVSQMSPP
jgi:phosphohistidine phosphatase